MRGLFERPHHWAQLQADQLLEQRLLVGKVQIDRALGNAGATRHVVEPRRRKAARRKFLERRRQDGVAALGRPPRARTAFVGKPRRRRLVRALELGFGCRLGHGSIID